MTVEPNEPAVRVHVLGCGDAFGSGGRLNTCFFIESDIGILLDCGASVLPAMKRVGLDGNRVDMIVLTHLHGDHFAGIPFLVRETQIAATRTKPLTIVGPPGHERVIRESMELLFPGSPGRLDSFDLVFREYNTTEALDLGSMSVRAIAVRHTAGTTPHAVRLTTRGRAIAYSGSRCPTGSAFPIARSTGWRSCSKPPNDASSRRPAGSTPAPDTSSISANDPCRCASRTARGAG